MSKRYQAWVYRLEKRALRRDNNRLARPFEWGLDYLGLPHPHGDPRAELSRYAEEAYGDSHSFYALPPVPEYRLNGDLLTFPSAIRNRHAENNIVYGRYFPRKGAHSAVVVLPQWNADRSAHLNLCRLLNQFGMAALRLSMPYHDFRKPAELERADYLVDTNVGRTIQSCRQAVLDARLAVEWLWRQGFRRVAILGTSVGACIGFLTFVHETRLAAAVFNHASSYFADVVWEGMTTRHVREGLQGHVNLEELRRYWSIISPYPFVKKLRGQTRKSLIVSARYDPTFLPRLSQDLFDEYYRHGVPLEKILLPCGHYTLAMFPFSWIDGFVMARFLRRELVSGR